MKRVIFAGGAGSLLSEETAEAVRVREAAGREI